MALRHISFTLERHSNASLNWSSTLMDGWRLLHICSSEGTISSPNWQSCSRQSIATLLQNVSKELSRYSKTCVFSLNWFRINRIWINTYLNHSFRRLTWWAYLMLEKTFLKKSKSGLAFKSTWVTAVVMIWKNVFADNERSPQPRFIISQILFISSKKKRIANWDKVGGQIETTKIECINYLYKL